MLWWEPFCIALLAPALLFPGRFWVTDLQPLWVVLLFAFWPLRLLVGRRALRRTPLDLPLLALVLAGGVALAVSPAPPSSWEAAGFLLLGVAAAAALLQWPPAQAQPASIAWLLLGAGVPFVLAGPLLLDYPPNKLGLGWVLGGTGIWAQTLGESINPNVLGGVLLVPTLLALAVALGPRWWRYPWRWAWLTLASIFTVGLTLTQCRGAYLALGVGVPLLLLLRWPRSGWLLIPLVGLGTAMLLFSGEIGLAFDAIGADDSITVVGIAGRGLGQRLSIWQAAVAALAQQPLTGIGLGLFGPWVSQHELAVIGLKGPPHAHNLLLQVAAELGLLGLAAYGGAWLAVLNMLIALLRVRPLLRRLPERSENGAEEIHTLQRIPVAKAHRLRLHWTLAAGAAAALAAVMVHGLLDAALWGNKVAFVPWLLFALITNLYFSSKESV